MDFSAILSKMDLENFLKGVTQNFSMEPVYREGYPENPKIKGGSNVSDLRGDQMGLRVIRV